MAAEGSTVGREPRAESRELGSGSGHSWLSALGSWPSSPTSHHLPPFRRALVGARRLHPAVALAAVLPGAAVRGARAGAVARARVDALTFDLRGGRLHVARLHVVLLLRRAGAGGDGGGEQTSKGGGESGGSLHGVVSSLPTSTRARR